jgi:hypothetical protein
MAANSIESKRPGRTRRRLCFVISVLVATPLVAVGVLSWWLTEPFSSAETTSRAAIAAAVAPAEPEPPTRRTTAGAPKLEWPAERLEGLPAKQLLLDILVAADHRMSAVPSYTATLRKRERMNGKLGPEQTLTVKVRHQPFAIYLKFLAPKAGKEVVYAEGRHDNKLIAHAGDWTRRLVPRIAVDPTDPLALADSRHPVTEAGIAHMTRRLISFRRMDLEDPESSIVMERTTDEHGQLWFRSVHTHAHQKEARPYARIEVLYDPETLFPRRVANFDWPESQGGTLELAESYAYDNVNLAAELSDDDFDPANPSYAFTRY